MNQPSSVRLEADETLEFLAYRNYRENRIRFPETKPERYACVYPDWRRLEARFQEEQAKIRQANEALLAACDGNPAVAEVDLANHLIADESGEASGGLLLNLFIAVGTLAGFDLLYHLVTFASRFPR